MRETGNMLELIGTENDFLNNAQIVDVLRPIFIKVTV